MILVLIAFYENKDGTNELSKAKMNNDLKTLSKQLTKVTNQKQAQALTNSLLLKMLENMQQQYELNINYTNAVARSSQLLQAQSGATEPVEKEVVEYTRNDELFEPETKEMPKDELGLPKFTFFDK